MRKIIPLLLLFSCTSTKIGGTHLEVLDGSKSYDLDGKIVKYEWRQISGIKAKILVPLAEKTLVEVRKGTYQFELTVTDNDGAIDRDTVIIKG